MTSEQDKAEVELAIFRSFVAAAGLSVDPGSERKGVADYREPDIICTISGNSVAFELAEAIAPEFAAAASSAAKSDVGVSAAWGEDVSHLTLRKKLGKHYSVDCPIHLLLYKNGFTRAPDWYIIEWLKPELALGLGPFCCIWFFGKKVHKVAAI
jgi:hypothetical protein